MVDSKYNTLLIIEGEHCEKNFFTKFSQLMENDANTLIIPFCNDIYELYKCIEDLDFATTTKDVILHYLKIEPEIREKIEKNNFVYTYLVFDLELQNDSEEKQRENLDKVNKMLQLFNNETEYGKLFVNYPMMESYRHFKFSNENTLKKRLVEAKNISLVKYKDLVSKEGSNKNVLSYKIMDFYSICKAHLMQANLLLNNQFKKPTKKEYEQIISIENIHKKQTDLILNYKYMYVLNTSSFLYAEFHPEMLKSKN